MNSDSVVVPPSFLQKMIEHAAAAVPNECCGVLGGKGSVVTSVHPLTNDLASPTRYFANPHELFTAVRKMQNAEEEMIGIFHSHPTSPPQPSPTDREENGYPGLYYFIISLLDEEPAVRCYVMTEDGEFSSVEMV